MFTIENNNSDCISNYESKYSLKIIITINLNDYNWYCDANHTWDLIIPSQLE